MSKRTRMYAGVKTWNPFVGCRFACTYCAHSFQRYARMQQCASCRAYEPHEHPERLARVPKGETIFVCSMGDISFAPVGYMLTILSVMRQNPRRAWYLQSKRPEYFAQFIPCDLPQNTYLVTTLETNLDGAGTGYGYECVSKAPPPSERWYQFCQLDWPRKVLTIEPVMDFDLDEFVDMIGMVGGLDHVWIGFNTKRYASPIPEPSPEKVQALLERLIGAGIDVRGKELRGLVVPDATG